MGNSYSELLASPEWKAKSKQIKERDRYTCQSCGLSMEDSPALEESFFEVHHKYYRKNWLPWIYPDTALITLCRKCHEFRYRSKDELNELIQTLSLYQFYVLLDLLRWEHEKKSPRTFWRQNRRTNTDLTNKHQMLSEAENYLGIVSGGITGKLTNQKEC
jgi:hypothetical protein